MWSENEPAVKLGGWEKRKGDSDETLHLRGREKNPKEMSHISEMSLGIQIKTVIYHGLC